MAQLAFALIKNPFNSSIEPQLMSIALLKESPAQLPATEVTATSGKQTVSSLTSGNGSTHTLRKYLRRVGKDPRQRCHWCSHTTRNNQNFRCWHYCQECNAAFCFPQYQVKWNFSTCMLSNTCNGCGWNKTNKKHVRHGPKHHNTSRLGKNKINKR